MSQSMSLLLKPFGVCAEFLNHSVMQETLKPGMERAIKYIQSLEEKDFKEKVCQSISIVFYVYTAHTPSLPHLNMVCHTLTLRSKI